MKTGTSTVCEAVAASCGTNEQPRVSYTASSVPWGTTTTSACAALLHDCFGTCCQWRRVLHPDCKDWMAYCTKCAKKKGYENLTAEKKANAKTC